MNIRLDQPWWLLVLLAIIPMAVAAILSFRAMSTARRWSSIITRFALLAAIAALLAGTTFIHETSRLAVVALVDISGSIRQFLPRVANAEGASTSTDEAITSFLSIASRSRMRDDLTGIVIFDGKAAAAQGLATRPFTSLNADISLAEGTDLEHAIELGAAMIPPDAAGRLILISDGVETSGAALRAARAVDNSSTTPTPSTSSSSITSPSSFPSPVALSRSIPIDVVPLTYSVASEVIVESLDSPPTVAGDQTTTIPLRVVLSSAGTNSGTLQLLHEGEPIDASGAEPGRGLRLTLTTGRHVQELRVPLGPGRVHRFEAVWEPDAVREPINTSSDPASPTPSQRASQPATQHQLQDTILTNNRASSFTVAPGKGAVLVVDGVSGGRPDGPGSTLPAALRSAGIDVQILPPESVQSDLLWLQAFDLVILQNVPADGFPRSTHDALAAYVTQLGGGLLMTGGPDSFGAGAWRGSSIEPILPVQLDLPERLVTPAAAVVIIVDNSGSMNRSVVGSNQSQQQIANEGAALAVMSMDKSDLVGVITFSDTYDIRIPLRPNADAKSSAQIIRSVSADGGTNLPPALEEAHRMLRNVNAEVKHVIVLSDGVSMGAERLPDLVTKMRADDIRVSSIAVGDGADTRVMSQMAEIGDGRFYRVTDPMLLPRIFLKAVRVVRTPQIREAPFTPLAVDFGSPVLEGLVAARDQALPQLNGLVLTQPRLDPTVVRALTTPNGEPVLAYWNAGIGRVGAFTSDAHKWAGPWLDWSGYSRFWTQLVRQLARPPSNRSQVLTLDFDRDRLIIQLDATDDRARPLDLLTIPASIYAPDGSRTQTRLSQVASGQYRASVPVSASGTYVVTAQPRLPLTTANVNSTLLAPVIGGASRPPGEEFRRLTSNAELLRQIAEATGGRVYDLAHPEAANLFDRTNLKPAHSRQPLFQLLAIISIALLLLDVATRRIAWDRLITREFGSQVTREAAAAMRDRSQQAQAAIARLRQTDATAPPGTTQAPLGEEDAERIVREQAERRRVARETARRQSAQTTSGVNTTMPPASTSGQPGTSRPAKQSSENSSGSPEQPEGSLLAAKRRARERMNDTDT
jgi:Mg-chelatase subunit ChlD